MRRTWLLRAAIVALVLLLLLSVEGVEAKKKGTGKKSKKAAAQPNIDAQPTGAYAAEVAKEQNVASVSSTKPVKESVPAASPPPAQPEVKAAPTPAELEVQAKRQRRRETALRAAKTRNAAAAARRVAKAAAKAKAAALAKQRADDLLAKKRAADTPDIRRKGHEKLRWLLSQSGKSGSRIISMDTATYNAYVSEGPRPYFLLLQYTALTSAHSCHYCHIANDAIIPVAQAHHERNKELVSRILLNPNTSTADLPEEELPVFYATVDMARNVALFKELNFQSAPNILIAPPKLGGSASKASDFLRSLPLKYRFNLQANLAPTDFNSFVNKLASRNVQLDTVKPGMGDLLTMLLVLSGLAALGFKYGLSTLRFMREFRGGKDLVRAGGLVLYCWCISGGMYNIIRNVQFADVSKDGSTNYINGDPRDQYAAEGLMVGVFNVGAALALVMCNYRAFDDSYASGGATGGKGAAKISPLQHLKNAVSPFFSPVVCFAIMLALWYRVLAIYSIKNGGYRLGFVWR